MLDDQESLYRKYQSQTRQAALAFLSERLDADYEPPKPPEVIYDETSSEPYKPELFRYGKQETGVTSGTTPGGGGCGGCDMRHLSINFRVAGSIQTDGCFPNSGLLSYDCGFAGIPHGGEGRVETNYHPCSDTLNINFARDYSHSLCTAWESCSAGGDPTVCDWHAGILMTISGHTIHFSYGSNVYNMSVATTRNCGGVPTIVDATYDSTVNGAPVLPSDITVPNWCAAVGTSLFSGHDNFFDYFQGECNCFGGPKRVIGVMQFFIYIDVT